MIFYLKDSRKSLIDGRIKFQVKLLSTTIFDGEVIRDEEKLTSLKRRSHCDWKEESVGIFFV
jgi:hypothetical protein